MADETLPVVHEENYLDDPKHALKRKAFELFSRGGGYARVADQLGIPTSTAHQWIKDYATQLYQRAYIDILPTLMAELERLDKLAGVVMNRAENGDLEAVDIVLKISLRKAKLMGLDQPIKFQHDVQHSNRPKKDIAADELEKRMFALYDRLAARGLPVTPGLKRFVSEHRPIDAEVIVSDVIDQAKE